MYHYIYELLQAPSPANKWTRAWEYHEHPDAFPIADIVEDAEDRGSVINRFGVWLKENRLGKLSGESFTIDRQAADHYFEGRFSAFQQAITALQQLNEIQFIHDHNRVQGLLYDLTEALTQKYGDYVLWDDGLTPIPFEEFLRRAQHGTSYCIGAVLAYKH